MLRSTMPRDLSAAGALLALVLVGNGRASAATPFPPRAIQHIVFVVQENRSVDNLFNGFPGADTVRVGRRHDGSAVALHEVGLDEPTDVDHARDSFLNAYDHGRADGFDLNGTQPSGKNGDFAYAYVISHEMGHHIQNQLGILPKVHQAQERAESRAEANALSVRIELMADCLAGVWAANGNAKRQFLEQGDVEKAVATAQAIGDDRLQKASRGVVVPDSFTHGSSAQRVQWLQRGLQSGQIDSCNTFSSR